MAATTSSSTSAEALPNLRIVVESNPSNSQLSELGINSWPKWGCPPGKYTLKFDAEETCYLVKGKVKVYPRKGSSSSSDKEFVEFGAGDLVTIPKGLSCTWDRPTVEVTDHKAHGAIPEPGLVVIARVTKVMEMMASADILCLGTKLQDVRATEIDKVDMLSSFRLGDIVRAHAVSFMCGMPLLVLGETMVARSWTEMQCPGTGQIKHRKVAEVGG
ncbi:hypothetical protein DVH24_030387 [Malus domestica]|uniref:(S)-ureidoglycine aminohydrolase cupin domain-containing protein n=1 Tax=Malus domestica TaxID=3750 RepID=A0A498K4V0_MALDO|nr:hypothetical protein DVH24_030387 [Malus domestica]